MDLSNYREPKPKYMKRLCWIAVASTIYRLMFGRVFWRLRRATLILFGASIDRKAYIYRTCKIFAPWNLKVGRACIGPRTEVYNKAMVTIGDDSVISQGTFLCTGSHDISSYMLPLVTKPINIGNHVWIAADVFIAPGITISDGSVVGARSAVFHDVQPGVVVGGNPATLIKRRPIS